MSGEDTIKRQTCWWQQHEQLRMLAENSALALVAFFWWFEMLALIVISMLWLHWPSWSMASCATARMYDDAHPRREERRRVVDSADAQAAAVHRDVAVAQLLMSKFAIAISSVLLLSILLSSCTKKKELVDAKAIKSVVRFVKRNTVEERFSSAIHQSRLEKLDEIRYKQKKMQKCSAIQSVASRFGVPHALLAVAPQLARSMRVSTCISLLNASSASHEQRL